MQITPLIRKTYARCLLAMAVVCFGGVASGQSITPTTLPDGEATAPYQQTLTADGFLPGVCCIWTLTPGTGWPGGLTFTPNGATATISGTPTSAGSISFTVSATDAVSTSPDQSYTITIIAGPAITPTTLPAGEQGASYAPVLSGTGGTAPYTLTLASGSLPNGVQFNNGAFSGTPTQAGNFPISVQVTDSVNGTSSQNYNLLINPPPSVSTTSLPNGEVSVLYPQQNLSATGGTPPYTWALVSAPPPAPGLSFSGGAITGTPTQAGTFIFTVQVTDNVGVTSAPQDISVTIAAAPSITTASPLPQGEVGSVYQQVNLVAAGGSGSGYTFALANGTTLPAGLQLNSGAISGTPTAAGSFNFTLKVTDSAGGSSTKDFSLTVVAAPTITTASPLPQGEVSATYAPPNGVTLGATGGSGSGYTFTLANGTTLPAGLQLNGGVISGTPTAAGAFNFTLKVTDSTGASSTKDFSLTVIAAPTITTTSPLPQGEAGAVYQQVNLSASGGSGSGYTFALANATTMPPGLQLSSAGAITGTPTAPGTFNFTVRVTDGAGGSSTQIFALTIIGGPGISNAPTLPSGTLGAPYSGVTLTASGGTSPYTWSISSGALPAGLNLDGTTGAITGTPTAQGTFNFTAEVTDAKGVTGAKQFTITIASGLVITNAPTLPTGEVNVAYSQTFTAAGGTSPYTWSFTGGALPGGLNLNPSTGVLSGTPNGSGTFNFTVQVKDANNVSVSRQFSLTIAPQLVINTAPNLPGGSAGVPYSQTISASGGVTPYSFSITSGALPGGLGLNASSGVISGTPTASGNFNFTVQVTDAAAVTASRQFSLSTTAGLTITTPPTLATGGVGTAYSQPLTASGGAGSNHWAVISGALPNGLSLDATTGAISGTPTNAGTFNFTVQVTDSASNTASKPFSITIVAGLTISTAPVLPGGGIGTPYSTTLAAVGGTQPYQWLITAGGLPAGVSLNPTTGVLSGTPTAGGDFNFTVQVKDSASVVTNKAFTLTIVVGLTITTAPTLPNASVGVAYSITLSAAGGRTPYHWSITAGALPAGLALDAASGAISGDPTGSGNFTFTVQVTDNSSVTASKQFTMTSASGLTVTTPPELPGGAVGAGYSLTLGAAGGTQPYIWSITAGALPAGMTLNASSGVITGTPTSAGTFKFTAQVTDRASVIANKQFTLSVASSLVISTPSALPSGSIGASYSLFLSAAGGTAPYRWSVSAGSLPGGLTLFAESGGIAGRPTSAGTYTFTVRVTDNASLSAGKDFTLIVAAGLVIATPSPLPDGVVGQLYSQTLTAAGGSTPYHWLVVAGTIPAGLSLNPSTGVISGTPTTGGNFTFGVQVTDNASATSTKNFTVSIVSSLAITTTALPGSTVGGTYSQTLLVSGGKPPYAWAITAGTIAPGLSLSSSDGSITGSPTTAGTFTFTVEVSDSASAKAAQQLSITITPGLNITTPETLPGATVGAAYSVTLTVSGGQSPYTWSITSGSLPQGLTLDPSTGIIQGKPTAGGNFSFTIQVVGNARTTATKNFKLAVGVAKPPEITVTGLPATPQPAQQASFNLTLASGYPLEITGRATLTFQADAVAPADDPAIQFSTGGRTVDFTIPANTRTAVFPGGQISLQTGTVSGAIHLSFALKAAGADLPVTGLDQTITIARAAPVIQRVDVQRSGNTIQISVVAFSTPRELTQAHLVFTPTPGSNLQTTDVVEKLNDPATQWYASAASAQYGGQVLVVFGFTASQGSVNTVQSVSVTLTNSQGTSGAVSAAF